jgi:hypothetical protein
MREPIKDGCELNEPKKGLGEFVVPSGDATMTLDAAEEIFDMMAVPIITAVKGHGNASVATGSDAATGPLCAEANPEGICIEALVGHNALPAQGEKQRFGRSQVVLRTRRQRNRDGPPVLIDDSGELRIESSFGTTNCLSGGPSRCIRPVLVQLNVRAIQMAKFADGTDAKFGQNVSKEADATPPTIARINRAPRPVTARKVAPRNASPQHVEHAAKHRSVILRRPAAPRRRCAIRPSASFSDAIRSIFLAAPSAAPESSVDLDRTCASFEIIPSRLFHGFEDTP